MSEEGTQQAAAPAAGSEGQQQGAGNGARAYTPDELERIIAQRVNKAKQGFADYDDLKAKAARADELEQAQQSDLDKLRTKAEREAEKRTAAEKKATDALERANTALKRAAVVAAAAKLNAADPGDVFTLLDKSSLTLDEESGEVQGATEAVTDLLKKKPHLLKRAGGSFDGGQRGASSGSAPDMNALIRSEAGFGPAQ